MNVNRKLFGTDGVRGVAGERLTAELALALGRAATAVCSAARPQVLIVRDTRESGPMLESGLAAGIAEATKLSCSPRPTISGHSCRAATSASGCSACMATNA